MNSIENRILRAIGEDPSSPDVFTSSNLTPIRDSVNDAMEELCTLSDSIVNVYKLPLIADTNLYKMEWAGNQLCYVASVLLPETQKQLRATTLSAVEKYDRRWMSTVGTPTMFFPLGVDLLGLYPMYSDEGYYADIRCVVLPNRYETSTEPIQIRGDWEDAVVNYAVAEYFLGVGDLEKSIRWFSEYSKYAGKFGFRTTMPDRWVTKGEI